MSYTLEHGSYYQRNPRNGDIEKMVDQVTIAFSCMPEPDGTEIWTIHRHGALADVQAWWKKNHEAARPLFGEIRLVTFPPKFDPERINAILERPLLMKQLLEEQEGKEPCNPSLWT